MARAAIFEQYGEPAYVSGIRVYTTVRRKDQEAANLGLRLGVMEYDRRHGYRGPEGQVSLPAEGSPDEAVEEALADRETLGDLAPALVLEASPKGVKAVMKRGEVVTVGGEGLRFVSRALTERNPDKALRRGSIVRLAPGDKGAWSIAQLPRVESALVSLDPGNGAISRWPAALTSTPTSSTTPPRRGGSPARASSHSSIPRRWRRVSRPPRS
jgi:penicillin-binding protein 1A